MSGLVDKYEVLRHGEPIGDCFVLRYDRDPHALVALAAYAASVRSENQELSDDLWRQVRLGLGEKRDEITLDPESYKRLRYIAKKLNCTMDAALDAVLAEFSATSGRSATSGAHVHQAVDRQLEHDYQQGMTPDE